MYKLQMKVPNASGTRLVWKDMPGRFETIEAALKAAEKYDEDGFVLPGSARALVTF